MPPLLAIVFQLTEITRQYLNLQFISTQESNEDWNLSEGTFFKCSSHLERSWKLMTVMKIRGAASEPRCSWVSSPPISLSLSLSLSRSILRCSCRDKGGTMAKEDRLNARAEPELDSHGAG